MKRIILAFGLVAAHKTVDEDVPDDVLLRGTDESFENLDLSYIKSQNYEKDVVKFNLMHKFSDDSSATPRGELILTKNKNNGEIMKVDLVDLAAASDFESLLAQKCADSSFY
jgi:hypothetical protein